jgi:signal transduction histidine kinase
VLDAARRELRVRPLELEVRAALDPLLDRARENSAILDAASVPGFLAYVARVRTSSGETGFVLGLQSRDEVADRLEPLLRAGMFTLAIAALSFVGFGSYLLHRRILAPLQQLSAATQRVAVGDLSVRTALPGSDELAQLSQSFDHMAASLASEREELVRAQQALARSRHLAMVGQLAAGVAHEVGNPIAAVLGYAEVLRRESGLSERGRGALEQVCAEALRVRALVRELLTLSRPDALELAPVQPAALLERLRQLAQAQPELARVRLEVVCDADLPALASDTRRLEQILQNLIQNAAHALVSTPGARIELAARAVHTSFAGPAQRAVALEVSDNGPGIDPDTLLRVFEPFFTTKEPGQGTGLGLWNAHRLAELLGGRLEAESRPGHTRFSLLLPVADGIDRDVRAPDLDHR